MLPFACHGPGVVTMESHRLDPYEVQHGRQTEQRPPEMGGAQPARFLRDAPSLQRRHHRRRTADHEPRHRRNGDRQRFGSHRPRRELLWFWRHGLVLSSRGDVEAICAALERWRRSA
jgi:hypothetical protein